MLDELIHQELNSDSELGREMKESQDKMTEEIIAQIIRKKLSSWSCQNQGYVLDGNPETTSLARLVFGQEEQEVPSGRQTNTKPEFVFVLESSDHFLKERVLNLPQDLIKANHNDEQGFNRRLQAFRDQNKEDNSVTNYFEDQEAVVVSVQVNDANSCDKIIDEVKRIVGKPHNYGLSTEQIQAEAARAAKEEAEKEAARVAEFEEHERAEKIDREAKEAEWAVRLEKLQREERSVLELQSAPFRTYLVQNVMPTLTSALIEICQLRPDDPIDYLVCH